MASKSSSSKSSSSRSSSSSKSSSSSSKSSSSKNSSVSSAAKSFASVSSKGSSSSNKSSFTSSSAKAGGGSVAPMSKAPSTSSVKTTSTKSSTPVYWVASAKWGGAILSNGKTVQASVAPASTKTTSTTSKSTPTTTKTTSSAGYVSSKNNWNWTTTYTKANWDSWTENSKWQVVSKVVNWAGMSVAPTSTSSSKKSTSTSKTSSSAGVWTPLNGNLLTNFANNTWTYKTSNPTTWSKAVATNTDWSIRYADGSTYNPKTGISTKPTTSSSSSANKTSSTVASNWRMSYDYTKNNAKWSPAIASMSDGSIRYADGSTYNPATGKTTAAKTSSSSFWSNITSILKNSTTKNGSTVASNWLKSWDYTKNNANGSKAVQQMADWSIRYADGSIYNPKTWQTTDKNWNIVRDQTQATQVTEDDARREANDRSNRSTSSNSSTYNPVSNNKTATTNRSNQSALSIVLWNQWGKIWDNQGNVIWMQSKSLDTGGNRNIASQEQWLTDNGDGTQTYIAPNGKQYIIWQNDEWKFVTQSSVDWDWFYVGDWDNAEDLVNYIRDNNASDGINRSNVDNKDAVRDAEIVGTYNAPSGKEYDILTNEDWKVGFININWEAQWFDSQAAALDYIDQRNPVGSSDTSKNTIKPEWQNRVSDSIEDMNERMEEREEEQNQSLEELREELMAELEDLRDRSDDTYDIKNQIITSMFDDIDTFDRDIDDAIDDLRQKSELLNDNERMRWARQRAAQLAAQWYLTSEQVAQVANYSLTDYNKELEANALEAAKAIAELRVNIAQKKQDYINAIRTQQFANENDRQNQINYISERFDKILNGIQEKENNIKQFYWNTYNSNLAMNAQNELGYESIINQNRAQNIADDQNQMRAFTDPVYRRQYILDHITDANLHGYAAQAIQYLMNNWSFIFPWKSNADNKRILTEQINKVTDAARQLQLENQKDLAKS